MKIVDSEIFLSGSHQKIEKHQQKESLVAWKQGRDPEQITSENGKKGDLKLMALNFQEKASKVSISASAQSKVQRNRSVNPTL